MNKERRAYISSCEISCVEELTLGGYRQKVSIEGKRKDLPVLVCLHGGPGRPVPFSVGSRGLFPEWTDQAVLVCWDQLGCGKNNYKLDNSFTIECFAAMTVDLIREIRTRFPQNKLYIFGASWGSVLSLKAAVRVPELIDGVIVWGQIVRNLLYNGQVKDALDRLAPPGVKRKLERAYAEGIDCDYDTLNRNVHLIMDSVDKYTDGRTNHGSQPAPVMEIAKGLVTGPDYTLRDFAAVIRNGYTENGSLWRELMHIDLTDELRKVTLPYRILQGETDLITPTSTVLETVGNIANSNIAVAQVVKGSGHIPSYDAMAAIYCELCRMSGCHVKGSCLV